MIYFAQDETTLHIKIGLTDHADAAARLAQLQTGNPSPIILLGTMPGDRDTERQLHQTFTGARVAGEWFRPVAGLLKLILAAKDSKKPLPNRKPWDGPLNFYFAGKMERNTSTKYPRIHCWREDLFRDLSYVELIQFGHGSYDLGCLEQLPVYESVISGGHNYVGPFYFESTGGHSDFAPDMHGLDDPDMYGKAHEGTNIPKAREAIFRLCLDAISRADVVFAWIDQTDCYGTVVEIGHAHSFGKTIWIAGPRSFRDLWFVYECADRLNLQASSAKAAFSSLLSGH